MTEVVSVKFKSKGKVYYFDPNGLTIEKGQEIIVETAKGLEFSECVWGNHSVNDDSVIPPLRPVIRIATEEDKKTAAENKEKEAAAFEICKEKISDLGLDMKLVDVEYSFDGSKILFCFTSDGRVDFRDLVKDLAATFKMRIELRQIGVRDEARMLGGLGICGKPFCCAQFLDDFEPVSIKMAKTQGLSLNPTKISGTCGRLMCCLKYEQEAYEDLVKKVPKVDSFVDTPDGKGMVTDINLLRSKVRVKLENPNDLAIHTYDSSEVSVLGGKAQRLEYLEGVKEGRITEEPRMRLRREKPAESSPGTVDSFAMPEVIIRSDISRDTASQQEESVSSGSQDKKSRDRRGRKNSAPRQEQPSGANQAAAEDAEATGEQQTSKRRHRGSRGGRGRRKPESKGQQAQQPKGEAQSEPKQSPPQQKQDDGESRSQSGSGQNKQRRKPYYRRKPNKNGSNTPKSAE